MRVLLIGTSDNQGGAARAMFRQHAAMRSVGIDSHIFCEKKTVNDQSVIEFQPSKNLLVRVKRVLRKMRIQRELNAALKGRDPKLELFSHDQTMYSGELLDQIPDADVYNLHWINNFVDMPAILPRLCKRAPVLWTLHDQNTLTGGCHYTGGCTKYLNACGDCPQLGQRSTNDLSKRIRTRLDRVLEPIPAERLHFIAPSKWTKTFAELHPFGQKFGVTHIPYSYPTSLYQSWDKETACGVFQLPTDKRILLFVADDQKNHRKGFHLLLEAIKKIPQNDNLMLVSAGHFDSEIGQIGLPWKNVGRIENEGLMSLLFNTADLFAIPSLEDNLPNTVLESMASGTPVVGFSVGGIPDMILPEKTGWLAKETTADALAEEIQNALANSEALKQYGENAQRYVREQFSPEKQVERYQALFQSMGIQ